MKNYGFIRLAAAVYANKTADVEFNAMMVKTALKNAAEKGVSLLVFPELYLTGYTCGDLFGQHLTVSEAEKGIAEIIGFTRGKDMAVAVGAPVSYCGRLYDCAIVIRNGNIKGIVPKTFITPAESRWFASGADFLSSTSIGTGLLVDNGKECVRNGFGGEIIYAGQRCNISPEMLFNIGDATFAVEFGSDISAPVPPSSYHSLAGAHVIACLAADTELTGSEKRRNDMLRQHSAKTMSACIYASAKGESTQDFVYAGAASIWETGERMADSQMSLNGLVIADIDIERIDTMRRKSGIFHAMTPDGTSSASYRQRYSRIDLGKAPDTDFETDFYRYVEPHPFAPERDLDTICREALDIQVEALCGRLSRIGAKAVIGISGGLDSTLALIVTALAFDRLSKKDTDSRWLRSNITGVTMPGFGTTARTKNNAWDLMEALGITSKEVPIGPAVEQHFKDIEHDPSVHDATYENSQARERTQILMDIANQVGGIVVGTGDLSELALGWATYNGDHMSMYGVNAGIPKTLVRSLVKWAAENRFRSDDKTGSGRSAADILLDIVATPISPELLPAKENDEIQQVTEGLVGPYELHDFFIYNFISNGYSPEKILFMACKAFCNNETHSALKTGYDKETIIRWLKTFIRRFFSQQFKRSCMPDGPKVCSVGLSPRGDWNMPSDAWSTLFQTSI